MSEPRHKLRWASERRIQEARKTLKKGAGAILGHFLSGRLNVAYEDLRDYLAQWLDNQGWEVKNKIHLHRQRRPNGLKTVFMVTRLEDGKYLPVQVQAERTHRMSPLRRART